MDPESDHRWLFRSTRENGNFLTMSRPTLLIPVVFPDPDVYPLDDVNIVGLSGFNVILFGYWETPEGTAPEVAREAHETAAEAVLYDMAAQLSRAGASTDVQLHFGPPGDAEGVLQDRIVAETDADGILVPNKLTMLNNVLVPLRDARKRDEIVDFVSAFDNDRIFVLELYHATSDGASVEAAEQMLEDVKRVLLDRGFSDNDVEVTVEVTDDPASAVADRARNHNIVVMGETEELDDEGRFLGPIYDYIARETETPIAVIRE